MIFRIIWVHQVVDVRQCLNGDAGSDISEDDSDDEEEENRDPNDPRAGSVAVVLPQLESIDYRRLSQTLMQRAAAGDVPSANRKKVYLLARK